MTTENEAITINTKLPMEVHPANMSGESPNLVHALTTTYRVWSQFADAEQKLTDEAKGTMPKAPRSKMTDTQRQFYDRDIEEWSKKSSVFRADLAKTAQPKIDAANATFIKAIASAQGQIDTLEAQIQQQLVPHAPTGTIHTEIRARLGSKPSLATLQKFIDSGDKVLVSTIIGSHPLLLGISEKDHDIMHQLAMKRYTPKEKAQLESVTADLAKAEKARETFVTAMNKKRDELASPEMKIVKDAFA